MPMGMREAGRSRGEIGAYGSGSLAELAEELRGSRAVLESIEAQALAGTVEVLVGICAELSETAKVLHSMRAAEWLTPEEAAAHVGAASKEAFEKIARQEGIPRHHLTRVLIRYNRGEVDEWLRARTSPP